MGRASGTGGTGCPETRSAAGGGTRGARGGVSGGGLRLGQDVEESRLALALNPNLDQPHLYRAAAFYHLGLLDLIEPALQAAAAGISPANQPPNNLVESERIRAITLLFRGRFQEAVPAFEGVKRSSNSTTYDYLLGLAYYYTGNPARAEETLTRLPINTTGDRRAQAVLASLLAARHANAEARALVKTILDSGYMDHHIAYSLGATYAQLGELTEANVGLEAARIGLPCYPWPRATPCSIRCDATRVSPGSQPARDVVASHGRTLRRWSSIRFSQTTTSAGEARPWQLSSRVRRSLTTP